jgi:biopolymer transport protein ExbB
MPRALIDGLGRMASAQGGFDPRKAYRLCQQHPSAAATIIRAMLLETGRPQAEVKQTVADACNREATRLYGNVRTLNLAAAVTPLLGLLGTVWGMIEAFFVTANAPVAGFNRAEQLADGIYVALVTTAAGLMVAIPAAMLAHGFEGHIQRLLLEVQDLLFTLLPQVERYEGKLRVSRAQLNEPDKPPAPKPATPEVAPPPVAPPATK